MRISPAAVLVLCSVACSLSGAHSLPRSVASNAPRHAEQQEPSAEAAASTAPSPQSSDARKHAAQRREGPYAMDDPADFNFPQVRLLFASFGLPLSQMKEPNFVVAVQRTLQQLAGVPESDTSVVFIEWYAVEAMILADSARQALGIAQNISEIEDEKFTRAMQENLDNLTTSDGQPFGLLSATQTVTVVPVSGRKPEVDLSDTNDILRENAWAITGVILALLVGAGSVSWFLSWGVTVLFFKFRRWLLPEKKKRIEETKEPGREFEMAAIYLAPSG